MPAKKKEKVQYTDEEKEEAATGYVKQWRDDTLPAKVSKVILQAAPVRFEAIEVNSALIKLDELDPDNPLGIPDKNATPEPFPIDGLRYLGKLKYEKVYGIGCIERKRIKGHGNRKFEVPNVNLLFAMLGSLVNYGYVHNWTEIRLPSEWPKIFKSKSKTKSDESDSMPIQEQYEILLNQIRRDIISRKAGKNGLKLVVIDYHDYFGIDPDTEIFDSDKEKTQKKKKKLAKKKKDAIEKAQVKKIKVKLNTKGYFKKIPSKYKKKSNVVIWRSDKHYLPQENWFKLANGLVLEPKVRNAPMTEKWREMLKSEFEESYWHKLEAFLETQNNFLLKKGSSYYDSKQSKASSGKWADAGVGTTPHIVPAIEYVYGSLNVCDISDIKVVIIGQDPYPRYGASVGLAFSTHKDMDKQNSVTTLFTALENDADVYFKKPTHCDLSGWVRQGVFLINTALTTIEGEPGMHLKEWMPFTNRVLDLINTERNKLAVVFLGKKALEKKNLFSDRKQRFFEALHPTARNAEVYHMKIFSEINKFLVRVKREPIDWNAL